MMAKMAKNKNNNDNNNNNDILTKYFGKEALNLLNELELPNKESEISKHSKNHKQSPKKEEDLSKIIESIKKHINQETKDKK